MLTELGLRNFKAFGDTEQKVSLSKITLIYGPNSGGKSSIIHALLMLKQSINVESLRSATKPKLVLRGQYVDLGSFSALIHKHEQNRELEIGIRTVSKADSSWDVDISLMAKEMPILSEADYKFRSENGTLSFNAQCEYDKKTERWKRTSGVLKENTYEYEYDKKTERWRHTSDVLKTKKHNLPEKRIADAIKGLSFDETYGYLPLPVNQSEISRIRESWARTDLRKVTPIVASTIANFERALLDMAYLGPLRSYPKRIYAVSDDARDSTGVSGEFTPHILHYDSRILKTVNKWFGQFEIPYKLSIDKIGDPNMVGEYVSLSLIDRRTRTQVTLTDVGFWDKSGASNNN